MKPLIDRLKKEATTKKRFKVGDHFTVIGLLRNGTITTDGSFIGDVFLVLDNNKGTITCAEWNKYNSCYKNFNYSTFTHGVNCILRKLNKPLTAKERQAIYKEIKEKGCDYHNIKEIPLI